MASARQAEGLSKRPFPSWALLASLPGPGTVCSAPILSLSLLCAVQEADGKSRQVGVDFFASFPMCHFLFCLRKLGNLFFSLCLCFCSLSVGPLFPDLGGSPLLEAGGTRGCFREPEPGGRRRPHIRARTPGPSWPAGGEPEPRGSRRLPRPSVRGSVDTRHIFGK